MKADILVIIVTFNGMQWIDRCIASVRSSLVPADILAIDNGSSDGTPEKLGSLGVRLIRNEANTGFGAANNIGMRRALEEGYKYVYLLNQDAWVLPDTFGKLAGAFQEGPYGILSPVQYDAGGKKMDRQFAKRCRRHLRRHKGETVVTVPFVMAAHWMISRSCLVKTGGFSPAFRQYGEDDNYIDRARRWGWLCGVVPAASGIHDRSLREDSPHKRMFLKCNSGAIRFSDPGRPVLLSVFLEPLRLAAMAALNFSTEPLKAAGRLIKRYPELIRFRKRSKKAGAFLTD